MPFYEYQCKHCGHHLEAMQKVNDAPLKKCPACGKSGLERQMSAPVFRLKGGGWYETDFKSDQEGKRNLADRPEGDAAKGDVAKGDAAKADAGKAEKGAAQEPAAKEKSADKATTVKPVAETPAKRPAGRGKLARRSAASTPKRGAKKPAKKAAARRR